MPDRPAHGRKCSVTHRGDQLTQISQFRGTSVEVQGQVIFSDHSTACVLSHNHSMHILVYPMKMERELHNVCTVAGSILLPAVLSHKDVSLTACGPAWNTPCMLGLLPSELERYQQQQLTLCADGHTPCVPKDLADAEPDVCCIISFSLICCQKSDGCLLRKQLCCRTGTLTPPLHLPIGNRPI